jgi:DNA-binding PadR family transcriptional regulator
MIRVGSAAEMRSPVNWALLGLMIERPSYGYELVQRFERTYGELLTLSSASQIYNALDALVRRGLIEEVVTSAAQGSAVRQPKLHYRATDDGVRRYQDRLIAQVSEDRRRTHLFARELAALDPQAALAVIDRYEQLCLESAVKTPPHSAEGKAPEAAANMANRLASEDERLAMEAKLPWIEYARREFKALLEGRSGRR